MARKRKPIAFGNYTLIERINVGGMAEVFKSMETRYAPDGPFIAIKRILPTMAEDDDFITMFLDEARIASRLEHPNVCKIYELGCVDETHFIAMEYIHGKDVLQIQNKFRKSKQIMPVAMAAYIGMRAAEGLDYAHRATKENGETLGLIHRDVSPQNILVSYEGEVKVIDFGIAKAQDRQTKTQAGILKGKFGYMSPEQVLGKKIDHRSDIFALGTVIYEMLTGERLFVGESDFSTLEKVRNVDIHPPRYFNDKIPERLEQIVLKALAKDRDQRYSWGSELAADLQSFLNEHSPFDYRRLSAWLKSAFAEDIARDAEKNEEFRRTFRSEAVVGIDPESLEVTTMDAGVEKTEIFDATLFDTNGFEDELSSEEAADKTEIFDASSIPGLEDISSAATITPGALMSPAAQAAAQSPAPMPPPVAAPPLDAPSPPLNGASGPVAGAPEASVPLEAAPPLVAQPAGPSLLKDILIGVSIAVVLVLGVVVGYFLFFNGPDDESATQAAPMPASPRGTITISEPKGASVKVASFTNMEGVETPVNLSCEPTPCELSGLEFGLYTLTVTHPDYEITETPKVKITSEAPIQVPVSVRPKDPGKLKLVSIGREKYARIKDEIEIYFNDEPLALSENGEAELPAGKRQVEFRWAGYLPLTKELEVSAGEVVEVKLDPEEFTEAKITLTVDSSPVKGRVIVDGKDRGVAPVEITDLPSSKTYLVSVRADGYEEFRRPVRWKEGPYKVEVMANLEKEAPAGFLMVNTTPLINLTVYVDGKPQKARTPTSEPGIRLAPGTYTLSFKSSKGKMYTSPNYTVEIRPGETTRKVFPVKD